MTILSALAPALLHPTVREDVVNRGQGRVRGLHRRQRCVQTLGRLCACGGGVWWCMEKGKDSRALKRAPRAIGVAMQNGERFAVLLLLLLLVAALPLAKPHIRGSRSLMGGRCSSTHLAGTMSLPVPLLPLRLRGGGSVPESLSGMSGSGIGGSGGVEEEEEDLGRREREERGMSPVTGADLGQGEEEEEEDEEGEDVGYGRGGSSSSDGMSKSMGDASCRRLFGMGLKEFRQMESEYLNSEEGRKWAAKGGIELVESDSSFDRDHYDTFNRVLEGEDGDSPRMRKGGGEGNEEGVEDEEEGGEPRERKSFIEELDEAADRDFMGLGTPDTSEASGWDRRGFAVPRSREDVEDRAARKMQGGGEGGESGGGQQNGDDDGEGPYAANLGAAPDEDEDENEGGVVMPGEEDWSSQSSDAIDQTHVQSVWKSVVSEARKHRLSRSIREPPTLSQTYSRKGFQGGTPRMYAENSEDSTVEDIDPELEPDEDDEFRSSEFDDEDAEMRREIEEMVQFDKDAVLREACRNIPEHVILPRDHVKHIVLCIKAGACLQNTTDLYGWTVLHHSAFHGYARVCRKLVKLGCDMEAVNKDGYTPLMCAARYGRREAVQLLIEMGANYRHCSKDGETVLDKAKRSGNSRLTEMIYDLFEQLDEEEMLAGGKTVGESMDDVYPDGSSVLRYQDQTGRWKTIGNATQALPQHRDSHVWRPLGWSYKDIDRMNRYEKKLPGWEEALGATESDDEDIDLTRL